MKFFENFTGLFRTKEPTLETVSPQELEEHMARTTFGALTLTNAIRPQINAVLKEGYKFDAHRDDQTGKITPVLMAAASREKLMDLFMEMTARMGETVDVVLETSHMSSHGFHTDLLEEGMDSIVLQSMLYDHEDLLLNDGCAGIGIIRPGTTTHEIQFDEHKLFIVYGSPLQTFEQIMRRYGLRQDQDMTFITADSHVHSTNEELWDDFRLLHEKISGGGDDSLQTA